MVFPFRWLYALEVIGGYWWLLSSHLPAVVPPWVTGKRSFTANCLLFLLILYLMLGVIRCLSVGAYRMAFAIRR